MRRVVVPTTLEVGDRELSYDLIVDLERGDPIGDQVADHAWKLSDALMWLLGCLRPGDAVLDVGAHMGTFALPAAMLAAGVVAIEGSPGNASILRAACLQNGLDNVDCQEVVVSTSEEEVVFVDLGPYGTIATSNVGPATGYPVIRVAATTLDAIAGGPFHWAKLDIEGMETAVIASAPSVFTSVQGMAVESNGYMLHDHGSSPAALIEAVQQTGMVVYEVGPHTLRPLFRPFLQPETVVDYVAVRGTPSLPTGWTMSHARQRDELLRALLAEAQHPIAEHRAYAERTMEGLPRRLTRRLHAVQRRDS